jgi:hypothetical protein
MHYLLNLEKFKIFIKIHSYRSYMFRSTTIIRELALNLAKVIFILKHSVKLRRYMSFGDVATCHRAAQVQYKLPDDGRRPKNVGAII